MSSKSSPSTSPPVVNLSSSPCTASDSSSSSSSELLLKNLQRYGWSPIRIDLLLLDDEASSSPITPPTRQDILNVFQNNDTLQQAKNQYTYRSAESGGTEQEVEPKESLEVKLSNAAAAAAAAAATATKTTKTEADNNKNNIHQVDRWCLALSKIAHIVCDCLEIPSNTMLENKENISKSLDLMRVFYYHSTPTKPQLGSSPHTDWGSWTIVWQDSVGGLETYCRTHNRWVPVPPPPSSQEVEESESSSSSSTTTTTWNCIVHVGDMASLALSQEVPEKSDNEQSNDDDNSCFDYCWPSPKHRVLTSTTQERASLVYFGYPPANTSIKEIQSNLKNWKFNPYRGKRLPLQDYYLLQDQSSAAASSSSSTTTEDNDEELRSYKSIESMSIQEIIQEKWKQVQRSSY